MKYWHYSVETHRYYIHHECPNFFLYGADDNSTLSTIGQMQIYNNNSPTEDIPLHL